MTNENDDDDASRGTTADMVVKKPEDIGDADFANYFCTYGYLYHQKDMLEDQNRMTAYSDAVRLNPCLLYTSPSPRDKRQTRMPSSA